MRKIKLKKGLIVQKLEDKTVLFDGDTSTLHTLNQTASLIFSKLKVGWDKDKIVKFLTKTFDVEEKKAEADVVMFLNLLKTKKVIADSTHKSNTPG